LIKFLRIKSWAVLAAAIIMGVSAPALPSSADSKDIFTINFMIGKVEIYRDGATIIPANGDALHEGDILHIRDLSAVELRSSQSMTSCKVTGPTIFRFNAANMTAQVKRDGLLYSLLRKLSQDVVHYSPRTIVTAVRGKDDPEREAAAAELMNRALSLYRDARYGEALAAFDQLSNTGVKKHTENLIQFYRAEILFMKNDFAGALALYVPLQQSRIREFRHTEICMAKAIICAAYTGDDVLMKELAARYKSEYGESGAYYSTIASLTQE